MKKLLEEARVFENDSNYENTVKVYTNLADGIQGDVDTVKVSVPFTIDIEARSWGIKGISLALSETIKVDAVMTLYPENDEDDDEEKDLTYEVNLSELTQDQTSGGVVTIGDMNITLTKDGKVDYSKSSIEVFFAGEV